MEQFSFSFTYTEPCKCNGLQPCGGEGVPECLGGCECVGGVCVGPASESTTCTDVWDEALIACKLLTTQTQMDGITTAYNYTTGAVYYLQA